MFQAQAISESLFGTELYYQVFPACEYIHKTDSAIESESAAKAWNLTEEYCKTMNEAILWIDL